MQGSRHHYTICKEEEKLVKTTRKLEKEEERACIDCHKSITELSLSLFIFWTNKENRKLHKSSKENPKEISKILL